MILNRKQQIGALVLQGDRDPFGAARRFCPDETSDPWRVRRNPRRAAVCDTGFYLFADLFRQRKEYTYLARRSSVFQIVAGAIGHIAYREGRVQVQQDYIRRNDHLRGHHGRSAYRFRPRIDIERYIIRLDVIHSFFKFQWAARIGRSRTEVSLGVSASDQ